MNGASAALLNDDNSWRRDIAATISDRLNNRGFTLAGESANDISSNISNRNHFPSSLHDNAPSSPNHNGEESADMLPPSAGRTTDTLTNNREQTRDTLTERFKVHVTEPAKVAARKLGKSAETVDAYRQIGVPQSWADMVETCRKYPAFALDVVEVMGLDIDRDRESYAIFLTLQRQMTGR